MNAQNLAEQRIDKCIENFEHYLGFEWFERVRKRINIWTLNEDPLSQYFGVEHFSHAMDMFGKITGQEISAPKDLIEFGLEPGNGVDFPILNRVWNYKLESLRRKYWGLTLAEEERLLAA